MTGHKTALRCCIVFLLQQVMWTDLPCQNFHLIFSLAILDSEKTTLIENKFGFTEILKVCFVSSLL